MIIGVIIGFEPSLSHSQCDVLPLHYDHHWIVLTATDVIEHPPPAIGPVTYCSCNTRGRQPEFFAMRVAHNSRSCRLLQRNFFLHSLNNSFPGYGGRDGDDASIFDVVSSTDNPPSRPSPTFAGEGAERGALLTAILDNFCTGASSLFRSELSAFSEQRYHQIS